MAKQNLLLVDDDAKSLRVLEVSLRNAGYAVTTAHDGAEALDKLVGFEPALIVSDTGMPELDGLAFCERVKATPRTANIPFIFLTDDGSVDTKVRGLQLGADDFLVRPIYLSEVVGRVRMLLQRRERTELQGEQRRFFGQLEEMGVIDLLQTFEQGQRSGAVVIHGPQTGRLWFADGALIDAQAGQSRGDAAVYRLLTWHQGRIEIDFQPVERTRHVHATTQQLLLEGMRRVDAWARMREQLPALETVFEVDYGELAERLDDLPPEVNELLRLFDGRRSALEVVDDADLDDLAALAAISRLYFEGILYATNEAEPAPAPTPAAAEPQRADLSRWLAEAPQTPAPVPTAPPMVLAPPVETPAPSLVDDLLATAQAMPATPAPRRIDPARVAVAPAAQAPAPAATTPAPQAPAAPTPAPGASTAPTADQAPISASGATPPPADEEAATIPLPRVEATQHHLADLPVQTVAPELPAAGTPTPDELLAGEPSLTDHAHEEAFFVDSQHDLHLPHDFIHEHDDREPMPMAAWIAIGLLVVAVLGGGLFFGLRDTVEPRVEPKDAIDGTWHQRALSKRAKLGPVAPIKASWQPDVPAAPPVAPPSTPASDAVADTPPVTPDSAAEAETPPVPTPATDTPPDAPASDALPSGPGFDALMADGLKLYEQNKFAKALGKFEQAVALKPNDAKALTAMANALMETGNESKALSTAEKVIKLDPRAARAHLIIGTVRQAKGETEAAVEAYNRYLKLAPSGPFAQEVRHVLQGLN